MKDKLSVGDMIKWERLRGKAFSRLDGGDEGDWLALMYVMSGHDSDYSLDTFTAVMRKNAALMTAESARLASVMEKSTRYTQRTCGSDEADERGAESPVTIEEMAGMLTSYGCDVRYVLHEMPLWELEVVLGGISSRRRHEMEAGRLYAWMGMLPHIDSKKRLQPTDVVVFPWEAEARAKEAAEAMARDEAAFKAFMNGELGIKQ